MWWHQQTGRWIVWQKYPIVMCQYCCKLKDNKAKDACHCCQDCIQPMHNKVMKITTVGYVFKRHFLLTQYTHAPFLIVTIGLFYLRIGNFSVKKLCILRILENRCWLKRIAYCWNHKRKLISCVQLSDKYVISWYSCCYL